jgi:hypothetical protein
VDRSLEGQVLIPATEVQAKRSDLNVKDLHDATGSMFKVFTARKRSEKLNDEKLRQDLEAKQMRQQAQMLKSQGFGRQQDELSSRKPQTLGARADPAHRKRFVLEDEDEEQEERIENKLEELNDIVSGVRLDAKKMNGVLAEQDVLIRKMAERVCALMHATIVGQVHADSIPDRSCPGQPDNHPKSYEPDPLISLWYAVDQGLVPINLDGLVSELDRSCLHLSLSVQRESLGSYNTSLVDIINALFYLLIQYMVMICIRSATSNPPMCPVALF